MVFLRAFYDAERVAAHDTTMAFPKIVGSIDQSRVRRLRRRLPPKPDAAFARM
jgi:hypothetical protein